jgi:rare lipoprotein A
MRAILATALFCLLGVASTRAEIASCYGPESGRQTASGERFDWNAMTAAHRTLPFGTLVHVCYAPHASGLQSRGDARERAIAGVSMRRCVIVRINDRGPWVKRAGQYSRDIDLSTAACRRIGLYDAGVGEVQLDVLPKGETPYVPANREWSVF